MSFAFPQRMSAGLRAALMITFGALWLSGGYWLILHYFFTQPSDFGPLQNEWAPTLLRVHGWVAVGAVFLLGWITAGHIGDRWPYRIKRVSGVAVVSAAAILAVTGYALYYTTDRVHDLAGIAHEALGVAAIFVVLVHWRRYRPVRRSAQAGAARRAGGATGRAG